MNHIAQPGRWETVYVTVCIAFFTGGLHLAFFDSGAREADSAGNIAAQLPMVPAYLYGAWIFLKNPTSIARSMRRQALLMTMVALCIASTLWSIDPAATARRSFILVLTTVFAFALCKRFNIVELARVFGFAFLLMFLATLIAAAGTSVGIHSDEHYPAVRGFFYHKNIAGRVFVLGFIFSLVLCMYRSHRRLGLAVAFCCTLGALLTLSVTAASTLVAILIAFNLGYFIRLVGLPLTTIGACVLALLTIAGYEMFYATIESMVVASGRDMTFTGRTVIWSVAATEVFQRAPLLGFGYEAFWTSSKGAFGVDWGMWKYIPQHSHNGFMQTLVSLGFVGLSGIMLLCLKYMISSFSFLRSRNVPHAGIYFTFFVYVVIVNFSEWMLLGPGNVLWVAFVCMMILLRRDSKLAEGADVE